MKIFTSWSGKSSHGIALALRDWLPFLFHGIELFVSSEDIRKGKRWPIEVSKELETSNFGIVCLTPDNLREPWILFEGGALSKQVNEVSLYTLLAGGLKPSSIEGPLSHFQHTIFEKEDFFKMMLSVHEASGQSKQDSVRLKKIFDKFWDELAVNVAAAIKIDSTPQRTRSAEDMLREVLETATYIARNMVKLREPDSFPELPPAEAFWDDFVSRVGKISPFMRTYLLEAAPRGVSANSITITFPKNSEEYIPMVENARNIGIFQKVLAEMGFNPKCNISFGVWPPPVPPPRPRQ